jgi:Ca2+-binding RTX toxin-like protein
MTATQIMGFDTFTLDTNLSTSRATLKGSSAATYNFAGTVLSTRVLFEGSAGNDTILGGSIGERLSGGLGNDRIDGGGGRDTLSGGGGADVFVMRAGGVDGDQILDFEGAGVAGGDRIFFVGFGAGASIARVAGSTYEITYGGGNIETLIITSTNGLPLGAGDFAFV